MDEPAGIRRCKPLLGTFVEVSAPAGADAAVAAAFAAVAHVHARMSFHEPSSDLAALRRARAGTPVAVDPATVEVLALARRLHEQTSGLFDVAVGARLVAAGFLPRPAGIDLRTLRGTTADLEIIDRTRVVCHRPMLIDLGGIAKGFAVDRAIDCLARAGIGNAVVNAGGDLRVIGAATVHLRSADHGIAAAIALSDCALASSSNLHARRRHRGRTVSAHLGRRRAAVLCDAAISVMAPRCVLADAMTKVAIDAPGLADALLAGYGGCVVRLPAAPVPDA